MDGPEPERDAPENPEPWRGDQHPDPADDDAVPWHEDDAGQPWTKPTDWPRELAGPEYWLLLKTADDDWWSQPPL